MQIQARLNSRRFSSGAAVMLFATFAFGFPLQGCGSGSSNTSLLADIIVLLITRAAGGIVKDNNTSLSIPPNSLQADTTIKVQPASSLPTPQGDLYLIPGSGYTYGPAGTTFSPAATITDTYSPASLPSYVSPDTIGLYSVSGATYTLVAGSAVNTVTNTVTAPVSSLGTFVLMGFTPHQDPD